MMMTMIMAKDMIAIKRMNTTMMTTQVGREGLQRMLMVMGMT